MLKTFSPEMVKTKVTNDSQRKGSDKGLLKGLQHRDAAQGEDEFLRGGEHQLCEQGRQYGEGKGRYAVDDGGRVLALFSPKIRHEKGAPRSLSAPFFQFPYAPVPIRLESLTAAAALVNRCAREHGVPVRVVLKEA